MFAGESRGGICESRVTLPKWLRADLRDDSLVLCRGLGGCLLLFSAQGYASYLAQLLDMGPEKDTRNLRRFLEAAAVQVEPDARQRVYIPRVLLEYAGLHSEVLWLGASDHVEMWSPDRALSMSPERTGAVRPRR